MLPRVSKLALTLTVLMHGALLLALLDPRLPVRAPPAPQLSAQNEVVHIRFYAEGDRAPGDPLPGSEVAQAAITEEPCGGEFYVGIGIVAGGYSGLVIMVAPGAPAARAGIRAGEAIVNSEVLGANRYTEGTPLELRVASQDGVQRTVVLRVEKICNA